jgi:hypothetical protein
LRQNSELYALYNDLNIPRERWEDAVRRDALQVLGIRGWRRKAQDTVEWKRRLKEAKA